jgi:hypothetical protein
MRAFLQIKQEQAIEFIACGCCCTPAGIRRADRGGGGRVWLRRGCMFASHHVERVKILSYERAGSEDLAQLKLVLRQVAALERYKGRIFADLGRRASKIKGDHD